MGSHSALQILDGAKREGFKTLVVATESAAGVYRHFGVADSIIIVKSNGDFFSVENELVRKNAIIIPHASFVAYVNSEELEGSPIMYFGNRRILAFERDRSLQRKWLADAGLRLPRIFKTPDDIDRPVIVKFYGAAGGKGYFLAKSPEEFYEKIRGYSHRSLTIQEYIIGVPVYIHYFYSPLTKELEIMSLDRRYESNVDSIGRIAAKDQIDINLNTSYNITGNTPLVLRESLLPRVFEMGEAVIDAAKRLSPKGIFGPFCLETVVTPELEFYVFEISARIVAGTNLYINGSPYTDIRYGMPMSTGRRIALEIKRAIEQGRLDEVLG